MLTTKRSCSSLNIFDVLSSIRYLRYWVLIQWWLWRLLLKIHLNINHLVIYVLIMKLVRINITIVLVLNWSYFCQSNIYSFLCLIIWLSNSNSTLVLLGIVIVYFDIITICLINSRLIVIIYSFKFSCSLFIDFHACSLYTYIISKLASTLWTLSITDNKILIWVF